MGSHGGVVRKDLEGQGDVCVRVCVSVCWVCFFVVCVYMLLCLYGVCMLVCIVRACVCSGEKEVIRCCSVPV